MARLRKRKLDTDAPIEEDPPVTDPKTPHNRKSGITTIAKIQDPDGDQQAIQDKSKRKCNRARTGKTKNKPKFPSGCSSISGDQNASPIEKDVEEPAVKKQRAVQRRKTTTTSSCDRIAGQGSSLEARSDFGIANSVDKISKICPQMQSETFESNLVKQENDSPSTTLREISDLIHRPEVSSDASSEASEPESRRVLGGEDIEGEAEDDIFEDVDLTSKNKMASSKFDLDLDDSNVLELTIAKAERLQLTKLGKKKHSVRAVHERCFAHYMSLISMVALGAWRNLWITDHRLHKVLQQQLKHRSPTLHRELTSAARSRNSNSHEFIELMGRTMKKFNAMFQRNRVGLRKLGYRQVSQMNAGKDYEDASEKFSGVSDFIEQAKLLQGSRDFGAQLFTALLRSYHFKVRLVFSTQQLGYKFNDREEFSSRLLSGLKNTVQAKSNSKIDIEIPQSKQHNNFVNLDEAHGKMRQDPKERISRNTSRDEPNTGNQENVIVLTDSDLSDLNTEEVAFVLDELHDLKSVAGFDRETEIEWMSETETKRKTSTATSQDTSYDAALDYPIFWTEIFDSHNRKWVAIDAMVKHVILVDEKGFKTMHPRGQKSEQEKLSLGYVVAYDANRRAKDVTARYASSWAKVKEVCLRADGRTNTRYDANRILSKIGNPYRDAQERSEDDSLAFKEFTLPDTDAMPKTLAEFRTSPKYLLEHQLREKEAFKPNATAVDIFNTGKGSNVKTSKVFLREDVVPCKTIENYHKEGRCVKAGEQPRKLIKARAMTTNRIREHQQQMAETGEDHVMQGIYSLDQTEYIIPPPIIDGIIPKNAYGNADVFVESMIPRGATHLKLKGAARIARKLEMNHAEAVVGFEFKRRGAIPVVLGVLVADENVAELEAAWHEAEEIRIRKEDKKRTEAALILWTKFLKGLRIRKRINIEYGIPDQREVEQNGMMSTDGPVPGETLQEQVAYPGHSSAAEEWKDYPAGGFVRE